MNVSGERSFDAPRQVVWDVLNDPSQMANLMPGVESFDVQDDAHWSAKVKVPLGLGSLPLTFTLNWAGWGTTTAILAGGVMI